MTPASDTLEHNVARSKTKESRLVGKMPKLSRKSLWYVNTSWNIINYGFIKTSTSKDEKKHTNTQSNEWDYMDNV
jgi:hypothetical protein